MITKITIQTKHIPPSVNALYFNAPKRGRVKTDRYRTWLSSVGWDMNGHGSIKGPFTCSITIDRKLRRKNADIDNRIKAILDVLQVHNIIENDNLCEGVAICWGEDSVGVRIELEAFKEETNDQMGRPHRET